MSETEKPGHSPEFTEHDDERNSQPEKSECSSEDSEFRDSAEEFHSPQNEDLSGEKNLIETEKIDENERSIETTGNQVSELDVSESEGKMGSANEEQERIESQVAVDSDSEDLSEHVKSPSKCSQGGPKSPKSLQESSLKSSLTSPLTSPSKIQESPLTSPLKICVESPSKSPQKIPPRTYIAASVNTDASAFFPHPVTDASSLLEARQSEISIIFDAKDESQQKAINTGVESLRNTYRDIRNTVGHLPSGLLGSTPIDWSLWDRVISDYHDLIVHEPAQVSQAVANGIPEEIRGIVWQLVAQSKNLHLEELYMHLKTECSIHEKAIKRDLTRTSFYTNVDAAHKGTELFNVIMAYSNFDPDVGYTQGMAFIAVPLTMNMTESECFCLLVTLMKDYGLRELFCPEMRGLHLLLHQFDRLLERHSPLLYNHLNRQGIRSSMYASQWFLTFFSYKFPLKVVLRIFDMVITQGVEAMLRLGLNLMLKNEGSLLRLEFDGLLDFLKNSLFKVYISDEFILHDPPSNRRFSLLSRKPAAKSAEYYKLDAFIEDSLQVDVSPLDLARWKAEFDQILLEDSQRANDIETLRVQNGSLRQEIKDLEMKSYTLNHDHLDSVQTLVDVKVALPELLSDIEEMRMEVSDLETKIEGLELKLGNNHESIPQDIEAQIHDLLVQNAQETERFSALEEQLSQLTLENETLTATFKENRKWFWKK